MVTIPDLKLDRAPEPDVYFYEDDITWMLYRLPEQPSFEDMCYWMVIATDAGSAFHECTIRMHQGKPHLWINMGISVQNAELQLDASGQLKLI